MTPGWKRAFAGFGLAPALAFLTGCWDFREVNERALALMVGIDAGERERYAVSVQVVIPQNLRLTGQAGGGAGQGKPYRVLREEGATPGEAVAQIRRALYRELDFGHTKAIVLGEDVARRGLQPITWVWRDTRVPGIAFLTVARGKAMDVVSAESPATEVPAFFLFHQLTPNAYSRDPAVVPVLRWEAFRHLHAPLQDVYLTAVTSAKYGVNVDGLAVFRTGTMAGWLNVQQTEAFNWILGREFAGGLSADDPGGPVSVRIVSGRSRYAVTLDEEDAPVLNVWLRLEVDLHDAGREVRHRWDETAMILARAAEARVRNVIGRLQAMQADPLGFGERLRRERPDHPAVRSPEGWRKAFARARVRVEAEVRLVELGYSD